MINIPYEELINLILEKKDITREELEQRIKAKMDQLSGLISKEGAAHIVANELGIKLFDASGGRMKINKILGGMRNVETVGKVIRVFEPREFDGKLGKGRVASMIIADETGEIRVVLWNDMVELLKKITPGIVVRVLGASARQNRDRKELHLNAKSKLIINPPGETIEAVSVNQPKRLQISELTGNELNAEIKATIVQVFELRFYEVCPQCQKRLQTTEQGWRCNTHGIVQPAYSYALTLFADDGTGNIRVVCFGNTVEQLTNCESNTLLSYREKPELFSDKKTELLGQVMLFEGRAVKNEMFDRIEFIARSVSPVDIDKEIAALKQKVAEEKKTVKPTDNVEQPVASQQDTTEPAEDDLNDLDIDEELI